MKKYFFSLLITVFLLSASSCLATAVNSNLSNAFSKGGPLDTVKKAAGYTEKDTGLTSIQSIITQVIKTALTLVGIVFLVLMIYGGFLWMTDRGSEAQVKKAINLIQSAVIGLIIVVSAYAITYFVVQAIGKGQLTSVQ